MKLVSLAFGFALYAVVLLLGFTYNGGHILSLMQLGEWFSVLFGPLACLLTGYGFCGTLRHLRAAFGSGVPSDVAGTERLLSLWIAAAYGTAFVFFILDLIVTMNYIAGELSLIGEKIAAASIAPLLATFLAEGLLRPLKHRIAAGK